MDEITQTIINNAALVYEKDPSEITLETNVVEELSSQSLLLVAFISCIEEDLDIMIDLREAAALITIEDFVNKVKELKG